MLSGKVLDGEDQFDEERWYNDELWDCVPDDFLWGCMVRQAELLRFNMPTFGRDPVALRLMTMGTYDWQGPDSRPQSTTQAVRFTTAIAGRLLKRLADVEDKVWHSGFCLS